MLRILALVGLSVLCALPARADETAMAAAVNRSLNQVILPAYQAFADHAARLQTAVNDLRTNPDATGVQAARAAFGETAVAFSAIEAYRFGPARKDSRFERLFFWPDHRSRGYRQVMRILRDKDPRAADASTLAAKSVAVQGLPALAVVLFGEDSNDLASGGQAFRRQYASAIADRIMTVSQELLDAWRGPFAVTLRTPGPDNPFVRSHGEAMQILLRSLREQLQVVEKFKFVRITGDGQRTPNPGAAPFPGTGYSLRTTAANLAAMSDLADAINLESLLPEAHAHLASEFAFYLKAARGAIRDAMGAGKDWPGIVSNPEALQRAAYAALPLQDATDLLAERLPAALGLVAGYNALDGD